MIPVLFEIGPIKLYSFGLLVLLAFAGGAFLVISELKRRRLRPDHLEGYPLIAMLSGIAGARLYWVFTHLEQVAGDPVRSIFGSAGLTWYGGLVGGVAATLWLARSEEVG